MEAQVESAAVSQPTSGGGEVKLKEGALGYLSNLVIGVASTAPAYSLAATLGFIVAVAGVGTHAPAVLLVSFLPMLCIATAYRYLNKADPDPGTTFAWVRRAMGPHLGWVNGWAIVVADIIVMAALAQIAAKYTFLLFGWDSAANSNIGQIILAVGWIALMTWICWRGIELSARVQTALLSAEVLILALFAVVALVKVYTGNPANSITPQLSWFNPFDLGWTALIDGVLLGVFIYWGWDSAVTVNEESEDKNEGPGRAAVVSTLLLVLIYLVVSTAAQAYGGTRLLSDNSDDVLSVLGGQVFSSPWDKLLILAVLTSASASTQTTILPTARTTLSMARKRAIPGRFASVHPRYLTPSFSTLWMGAMSILWTVLIMAFNPAQNVLGDSISALGFAICFYYGFTGLACIVYFRREITKSVRNFVLAGVLPFVGFVMLAYIFGKAAHDYSQKDFNYSPPFLGIEVPIVIGIGGLLLGFVAMLLATIPYRDYFRNKPYTEVSPPGLLEAPVEHAPAHLRGRRW
ncbi:MAG TPA: APC family permease [Conexibacter sp.]|nr:APC family permease [Conexibacter sp.]